MSETLLFDARMKVKTQAAASRMALPMLSTRSMSETAVMGILRMHAVSSQNR